MDFVKANLFCCHFIKKYRISYFYGFKFSNSHYILVGIQQNLDHCMLCFLGSQLILITMNFYLQKEKENLT